MLDRELQSLAFGSRQALDGAAADPRAEAARYQALLDDSPIDLAVLGIGRDAHVAFNEPGAALDQGVRRVALQPSTIEANAAEFGGPEAVPREALTVGLRMLRAAREIILLAEGEAKAEALFEMLEGQAGPQAPASLLRDHPALTVICDAAAAARLAPSPNQTSDRVVVVLGHREPGVSPEHRISAHSRARMFHAEEACLEDPVRAAVLTGYTATGGLSEAEQMAREWTVPGVAALTERAGRNTAENASRSLPLILAIGGIRPRGRGQLPLAHPGAVLLRALPPLRTQGRPAPGAAAAPLGTPARRGSLQTGPGDAPPARGGNGRGPHPAVVSDREKR